jgi:enoyl-CoA hydratase/carnithine racemase
MTMTIDNPQRRNAMGPSVYGPAADALRRAHADRSVGAVIIHGQGDHFCGGGDLNRLKANREQAPHVQRESVDALNRWIASIAEVDIPVIAAVEGHAAGAGFALALGCDLLVASQTAQFTMAYIKVGLTADGGASTALIEALPRQLALELLLDGTACGAPRLHGLGVVNRLVAPGEAYRCAREWAERISLGPPTAQGRMKQLIRQARSSRLARQLGAEADYMVASVHADEAGEGIDAFFAKRAPRFVADEMD